MPMCVPCCPLLSLLSEISQLMIYIANLISSWCEDLRYFGDHRDPSLDDFVARDGPAFVPQPFDIYPVWLSGPTHFSPLDISSVEIDLNSFKRHGYSQRYSQNHPLPLRQSRTRCISIVQRRQLCGTCFTNLVWSIRNKSWLRQKS